MQQIASRIERSMSRRVLLIWWATLILAAVVAIVAVVWAAPLVSAWWDGVPSPPPRKLHLNTLRVREMSAHAVAGAIALMIGPWQLLASVRAAHPWLHLWLGRTYVAIALISAGASLLLLPKTYAFGAAIGFHGLGLYWVAATLLGVMAIRRGAVEAHRRWMLRSYALAWGAVWIRLFYIGLSALDVPFIPRYGASLWLAIVTVIVLTEIVLRRSRLWA